MATQWHTAFAFLLRPLVEQYYDVMTNMPVGDLPREADLVLLRRTVHKAPPFQGLWRRLTEWSILEYKGPTVSARLDDIDLLVELGLGIARRLDEECKKNKKPRPPSDEVSFWYLAGHIGSRFVMGARKRLGMLESVENGVWKTHVLRHPVYLVSSSDLAVESDSLPFHMLGVETVEKKNQLTRFVNDKPALKQLYEDVWASLHPDKIKEFLAMARNTKKGPTFHLLPLVDVIGWDEAIRQLGEDRIVDQLASNETNKRKTLSRFLEHFSRAELEELLNEHAEKQRRKK